MPLNPKIEQVLDMIARAKRPAYHELTAQQARASYEKSAPILDIAPAPMFSVEDLAVPTRDGTTIRARLYQPVEPHWAEPAPAFVYFHGGGFTVGSVDTHDALCRMFARDAQCAVLSVDYRLAPEHTFPTAVDDAFDALTWLHANAAPYGIDADRIAVGGDSAGGTLATVCAVLARDAGLALALQLLIYPGTTSHQQTDSHTRLADGFLLSAKRSSGFFRNTCATPTIATTGVSRRSTAAAARRTSAASRPRGSPPRSTTRSATKAPPTRTSCARPATRSCLNATTG